MTALATLFQKPGIISVSMECCICSTPVRLEFDRQIWDEWRQGEQVHFTENEFNWLYDRVCPECSKSPEFLAQLRKRYPDPRNK